MIALTLCATARADLLPSPPAGRIFLEQSVRVEGADRHPGFVLIALDSGPTVPAVATWRAGSPATLPLANGLSNRGPRFRSPALRMLTAADYDAWRKAADAAEATQRAACAKGEGCMHISRFVPALPAPAGATDCGLAVALPTEGPESGPDAVVTVLDWAEAAPGTCVVRWVRSESTRQGRPYVAPSGNCDATAGWVSGLSAAAALLGTRRRRSAS